MAEVRHFPQAGHHATRENVARKASPAEQPAANAEKYCVYNQTRERFVATGVEAVDASLNASNASLPGAEVRLRSLQPGTGAGLWILPCPEIAPTSIRFPVDLVYLNRDGAVLVAIQSFPLGGPAVSSAIAGSLLVLPESTVTEGEIHVGDRIVVAAPEEMKRHLQGMKEAKAAAQAATCNFLEQFLLPSREQQPEGAAGNSMADFGHDAPVAMAAMASVTVEPEPAAAEPLFAAPATIPPAAVEIAAPQPLVRNETLPQAPIAPQPSKKKEPKGWLARMFQSEPEDARISLRESLPGLIAYYFTGGTPQPHAVRDISPTGMYIVTEERWYPGTVVRVTLTDRHDPKIERSITVNAKAVRAGSDGVGFEFVLDESNRGKVRNSERMERANGMYPEEIEEFLRIYKSS